MAFNYSTAYMKSEPLSTEKEKQSKEYFENQTNYFIALLVRDNSYITTARNYYSSKRSLKDFQFLEDVYGMQNPIDLGFTNIIKPRVDALVGLSLLSDPEFVIEYTDIDTIKSAENERMEAFIKELDEYSEKHIIKFKERAEAQQGQQGPQPQQGQQDNQEISDFMDTLSKKYGEDFESTYTQAANHILQLIESDTDIDLRNVKKELAKDYFITGQAYTKTTYVGKEKDPEVEKIMPELLFTNRPRIDTDLKRADAVVYKRMLRPHQILKEFGHMLSKEDAVKIFGRAFATTGSTMDLLVGPRDINLMDDIEPGEQMDTLYMSTGYSNGGVTPEGAIYPVYHVEWLASTKIKDGKGGYVYREDRYEGYRIGSDIFVGGRRCDEAPRRQDKPWKTSLSYSGILNHPGNGHIISIVLQMKELQDLYDIIMFFRNNTVAVSGVSGSRVNVAGIPKALGNKFMDRLTKWLTLRKQGVELIDPTEDGAQLFQHYGDFNAAIRGDTIQGINAILESLTMQADIISGVPRQMLGIIEERDAVENVKVGMNQVSVLSLEMFRDIDRVLARALQKALDAYKYAYSDSGISGVAKNGIAMIPFIIDPSKYAISDHHISVISAGLEADKLLKVQNLAKELLGGGVVDADVVTALLNVKSVKHAEYILKKGIEEKKKEMANLQQLQGQLEDAANTIKQLEAELDRLNNMRLEVEKAKLETQKEFNTSTNDIANRRLDLDAKTKKKELEIDEKELQLKREITALEREQLLQGSGAEKEINNNKV
jgi:hypothetical protein